ncbi:MAG TPA: hypothetical protein VFJ45_04545 [bacterium]|nr:hypothetical protein [bacterium]
MRKLVAGILFILAMAVATSVSWGQGSVTWESVTWESVTWEAFDSVTWE